MTSQLAVRAGQQSSTPADQTPLQRVGTNGRCTATISKINQIGSQIGWQSKKDQFYDPSSMQYETRELVDYSGSISSDGVDKVCKIMQGVIDEQNTKLAPHPPHIDLEASYYSGLNSFLTQIQLDAKRVQALQPGDPNKYYALSSLEWYDDQFAKAADGARENAIQKEDEEAAKRIKGTGALYVAGSAFAFFFACCLVLVFIRIEVNTREIAEAIRVMKRIEIAGQAPSQVPTSL